MLPLGALFFFLFVFLAVVVVTMRRRTYEPVANLPLDSEDELPGEAREASSIQKEDRG